MADVTQRDREARRPSIGTELGQIGADIIAHVRTADAARIAELEKALRDLRDHYIGMIDSDDCGSWNPREEPVIIAATTALGGQS